MNWYRAKNLILLSLLVLNIVLILLIIATKNTYTLTQEQAENTHKVLSSKYNIGIYTELPKKYNPRREIEMVNIGPDISVFLYNVFLKDFENINKLVEDDKITYQGDNKTLMVQSGDFVVSSEDGFNKSKDDIMKELSEYATGYYLYEKHTIDDVVTYDYRQKYKGEIIYSNYLTFEETGGIITKIEGYYAKPNGYIGDYKEIVSVDMALFALANFYPKQDDEQIFIDGIELVYNQEQISNEPNVILKATPCYLIRVRGNQIPVKIDAYTNERYGG